MTYIICEPGVGTCDTACVDVCPVDCIHGPEDKTGAGEEAKVEGFDPEGKQLYIDPENVLIAVPVNRNARWKLSLKKVKSQMNGITLVKLIMSGLAKNTLVNIKLSYSKSRTAAILQPFFLLIPS